MERNLLLAEAGPEFVNIVLNGESARFGAGWDAPGDGAAIISDWLKGRMDKFRLSCVPVANARETVVRLAGGGALKNALNKTPGYAVRAHFPICDRLNEKTHEFGREKLPCQTILHAALPVKISEGLVGMCGAWGIRTDKIKRIVTSEYAAIRCVCESAKPAAVAMIPQEGGTRLIAFEGGKPAGIFFVSSDPEYRLLELDRIVKATRTVEDGSAAVLFSSEPDGYEWIGDYFASVKMAFEVNGDMLSDFYKIAARDA
ncbi:MAG: hypothetical protein FWF03_01970 [Defluviitaleaceae bacterium]|nr:hypothetical protein [Defluviitaleaceae bacterium]